MTGLFEHGHGIHCQFRTGRLQGDFGKLVGVDRVKRTAPTELPEQEQRAFVTTGRRVAGGQPAEQVAGWPFDQEPFGQVFSAFEIACLLADDDGRETSLDLPHAWEAVAASLTTHVAYDALRGFYDEYQELRHRLHTRSATFSAAARRARLLAAVALSESRIPAFENVVIGLSAP